LNGTNHIILHIPHDSAFIPEEEKSRYLLTDAELEEEVRRMTDHFTYQLVEGFLPTEQVIRAGVSRLVLDVERFTEDYREPMSNVGMEVLYEKTSDGRPLRRKLSSEERRGLLDKWYFPHQRRLADAVDSTLERFGKALIIDIHSYPLVPLGYELSKEAHRPQVCIGTDEYHTSPLLAQTAHNIFRDYGFETDLNTPFSGAIVPARHYRKDPSVSSIMIEIRRDTYMEEEGSKRGMNFFEMRGKLHRALEQLGGITPLR
jgi:N-formylglutamate amidohydrolase